MFIIKGTRKARIKIYKDHDHICSDCKDFDMTVKVYKEYFHFFFIPIAATGVKTVKIRCNRCGEPFRSDSLNKQYEEKTRVPFYLYTGTILVAFLILAGFSLSLFSQHEKSSLVSNPRVGDVYLIEQQVPFTSYYFIRIVRINGDSVIVYRNNLQYTQSVSEFNQEDHFDSSEATVFPKGLLKDMLGKGVISAVERDYDDSTGFNRIR